MATLGTRLKSAIDLGGALAIIAVAGILGWRLISATGQPPNVITETKKPDPVPTALISLGDAFSKGSPSAPVTIVEYGDMECPACAAFANSTYKALMTQYVDSGRVRFMFKHFPLPKHTMAKPAAIAAQCAGQQGQFWQFYEAAYAPGSKLSELFLRTAGAGLKLDMARWSDCKKNSSTATIVQAQLDEAMQLRLRATPAFLVGRMVEASQFKATAVLYGSRDLAGFTDAISRVAVDGSDPRR